VAAAHAARPGAGSSDRLLAPATATAMLTPQTARARKAPDMPGEVGLGPFVRGAGRALRVEHGGVNEGFVSNLVLYPALGVGGGGDGQRRRRAHAAQGARAGARRGVRLARRGAAPGHGGRPRLGAHGGGGRAVHAARGAGRAAEVRQVGGRLYLRAPQLPPDEELLPTADARGETRFVTSTLGWGVAFARDAAGRATGLTVTRGGGPAVAGAARALTARDAAGALASVCSARPS
jgi:hypothetical protein